MELRKEYQKNPQAWHIFRNEKNELEQEDLSPLASPRRAPDDTVTYSAAQALIDKLRPDTLVVEVIPQPHWRCSGLSTS